MLNRFTLSVLLLGAFSVPAFAVKHIVKNTGLTFSPKDIIVSVGDTVVFQLANTHNAVEVSKTTWDANGNTANGGFEVAFGGGTIIVNKPGILYYVCKPHAALGMKGTINVKAGKHLVKNTGLAFTPKDLIAKVGDTVVFELANTHNALEVSKATWDANGKTPNGGFETPFGGGTVILNKAGTLYYVCEPHAGLGMKGTIAVAGTSGAFDPALAQLDWRVSPNPTRDQAFIQINFERGAAGQWNLSDALGRTIQTMQFRLETGENTVPIDTKGAPAGIYLLQLWIDGRPVPARKLRIE
jgi:plastocyanin